jgi:hypothetical protein
MPRVAGVSFDQHEYDPRGDVLYLSVEGHEGPPATAYDARQAVTPSTTSPDD